jgi:Recombinase
MSPRVPLWLKALKGKPIEVIPERAAIVRKMFEWAAKGLGAYMICDKLVKPGVPPWGPVYKGRPPRWTPYYVSDTLRNPLRWFTVTALITPASSRLTERASASIRSVMLSSKRSFWSSSAAPIGSPGLLQWLRHTRPGHTAIFGPPSRSWTLGYNGFRESLKLEHPNRFVPQ